MAANGSSSQPASSTRVHRPLTALAFLRCTRYDPNFRAASLEEGRRGIQLLAHMLLGLTAKNGRPSPSSLSFLPFTSLLNKLTRARSTAHQGGAPRQQSIPRPSQPPATRPVTVASQQVTLGQAAMPEPLTRPHYIIPEPTNGITLSTNCFDLTVSNNVSNWYKYQVIITADDRTDAQGNVRPARGPPPKSVLRLVWQEVERREAQQPTHFGGIRPAFDGRSAAYTNQPLPDPGSGVIRISGIPAPDRPRMTFTITLSNVIPLPLASLRSYYLGTASFYFGEVAEALQALNTVLSQGPSTEFFGTRTSFFPTDSAAQRLGGGIRKESVRLNGYIELLRGWFQSVRTCERGLQVNINTTSTAFFQPGTMVDFAAAYCETNGRNVRNGLDALIVGRLDGQLVTRINRLVCKKIEVTVRRGPGASPLKMKIRGRGILDKRPCDHFFTTEEGETDVKEYMEKHFGVRLQHPNLPLVEVRPNIVYPLEMIWVDEGNKYLKRLSPLEQGKASDFATLLPPQKLAAILSVRRDIYRTVVEPHLTNFGVQIAPQPKQIQARLLPPPAIEYKDSKFRQGDNPQRQWTHVDPANGEWRMNVRGNFAAENFIAGASLGSFVVVVPSQRDIQAVETWLDALFRNSHIFGAFEDSFQAVRMLTLVLARAAGMNLKDCPPRPFPRDVFHVRQPGIDPEKTVHHAVEQARMFFRRRPDIIFWVFNEANSPDYNEFKRATTVQGIASQAIQQSKLHTTGVQMMINCALKVNGKLGGHNHRLEAATVGTFLRDQKPMIFGADLTHEPDQPSVAVVVASMHGANVLYEETISVQGLLEPTPAAASAGARPRKQEMIENLQEMVLFLLRRRALSLRALPPVSMLMFRDGVSEGEFATVIAVEVNAFHQALRRFKADAEMRQLFGSALDAWKPKLTVIATVKRHHIRAFVDGGQASNIPPGTFFDTGVTDARSFDVYGAAHRALIGTTRATRYVVLHDEQGLSTDDVEQIANSLCHSYQRTNKAVSLPAPVYYADLIARRVRPWFLPHDDTRSSSGHSESTRQSREADLVGARARLDDTVHGRNAFRGENSERAKRPPAMWWL
uniref:BY PROTMAP: gi/342321517/gb/EGU13450.1/ Proteophosphoglycan ppg4 [Rhodotorula glutinis ATCC 204091] n=1 Tax=Rhodotorula toruloides TaxID=5286 RepID=A0A0K3CI22_RHOTO